MIERRALASKTDLKDNTSAQQNSLETEHKVSKKNIFWWHLLTKRHKKYYIHVYLLITHGAEKTGSGYISKNKIVCMS